MVTAILKIGEMMLLKYLTKEEKSFPKTMQQVNYLNVINCPFIFKTLTTMNSHFF